MTNNKQHEETMTFHTWLALIGLTCSGFIFNTSEYVPIGLMSSISTDFGITMAKGGMLISVYAWVVMILSLPLMLMVSKIELRKLILCVIGVFVACQLMSFLSTGYPMLMASRIGVACTHAIFWSIVSPIAVRIVPQSCQALALSAIVTGTSVAMIVGMPLARVIGLMIGWRMTFLCVGAFALLSLIHLYFTLPKVSSCGGFSVKELPALFKNKSLVSLYMFVFLVITTYYISYSYVEPFLKQVVNMPDNIITGTLMIFGAAGIVGSLSFSKFYIRNRYRFIMVALFNFLLCFALIYPLSFCIPVIVVLCGLWGISITSFSVSMQSEIISHSSKEAASVAMSIYSSVFNLGIGSGALIGGAVCTYSNIAYIGFAGAIMCLLAITFWYIRMKKLI